MAKSPPLRPGHTAPASAQYGVVGPRGGLTGAEITGVRGKTLPPTAKPGQGYVIVDRTKNGSGRSR